MLGRGWLFPLHKRGAEESGLFTGGSTCVKCNHTFLEAKLAGSLSSQHNFQPPAAAGTNKWPGSVGNAVAK